MSGLGKLIALQKKKAQTNDESRADSPDVSASASASGTETQSRDSDKPATLSRQDETPAAEAGNRVDAPAKPKLQLGLKRLGALTGGSGGSTQRSVPAERVSDSAPDVEAGGSGSAGFSLDDIAKLDEQSTPQLRKESTGAGFLDEIEATAPDRDLPADLTTQQLNFVEQLDGIYGILHDPEMFAQAVRIVMVELQENPEYIKLVSDPDVHTMMRGMRNSMSLARVKKQEKSRKAGGGTKKAARSKSAEVDSALALLNALGGDDDD